MVVREYLLAPWQAQCILAPLTAVKSSRGSFRRSFHDYHHRLPQLDCHHYPTDKHASSSIPPKALPPRRSDGSSISSGLSLRCRSRRTRSNAPNAVDPGIFRRGGLSEGRLWDVSEGGGWQPICKWDDGARSQRSVSPKYSKRPSTARFPPTLYPFPPCEVLHRWI